MSFHDRVVQGAIKDGNTATQFRRAAQLHANGTWMFLFAGGIIWYFAGWEWVIIPAAIAVYSALKSLSATHVANKLDAREREQKSTSEAAATDNDQKLRKLLRESVEVVSRYAAILERGSDGGIPTLHFSEAELPNSKEEIVRAIATLQQALKIPRARTVLVELLSPMEAQQILSPQFAQSLETGLVLLDRFVSPEKVDCERKEWEETLALMNQIDSQLHQGSEDNKDSVRHVENDGRENDRK